MPSKYEVVTQCYVPVGSGFKYKKPGQVVTLKAADAKKLGDSVKKLDDDEGVAKRNTPEQPEPPEQSEPPEQVEPPEEVTSDAGEPSTADERTGAETLE